MFRWQAGIYRLFAQKALAETGRKREPATNDLIRINWRIGERHGIIRLMKMAEKGDCGCFLNG